MIQFHRVEDIKRSFPEQMGRDLCQIWVNQIKNAVDPNDIVQLYQFDSHSVLQPNRFGSIRLLEKYLKTQMRWNAIVLSHSVNPHQKNLL